MSGLRYPVSVLRPECEKLQMAITQQRVIRSTSCLVLGWGFRGRRIERRHFRLDQIQYGGRRPFLRTSNGHNMGVLARIALFHLTAHELHELFFMISLLLREALDRLCVRLNMYLVVNIISPSFSRSNCYSVLSAIGIILSSLSSTLSYSSTLCPSACDDVHCGSQGQCWLFGVESCIIMFLARQRRHILFTWVAR